MSIIETTIEDSKDAMGKSGGEDGWLARYGALRAENDHENAGNFFRERNVVERSSVDGGWSEQTEARGPRVYLNC